MSAMFSLVLMTSAATYVFDAESTRIAYNNCLVEFTSAQLELKTTTNAYRKIAKDACTTERDAMHAAVKKDEIQYGSSASEADDYAQEEVGGVLFYYTDRYSNYLDTGTQPMKQ